jgi:HAMP domain-containing protein
MAVVPINRVCDGSGARALSTPDVKLMTVGPWSHVDPPQTIPSWIDCAGFSGVLAYTHRRLGATPDRDTHLLVRAVAFPDSPRPGYAVVVDLLVNDAMREQLRRDTGVELKTVVAAPGAGENAARPLQGREGADEPPTRSRETGGLLSSLPTLLIHRDWNTGATGALTAITALNIGELYDHISSPDGGIGRLSQGLLLVLFVIGALFLIIEAMALIAGFALAKSLTGSVHELFTGTERVRQGDFTHKIAIRSEDQLGELAASFNSMTASIEDLLRQAAEKKRLEEELRIAHEIQMSLLPQGPLKMRGLSVTALCVPAREVGGDY